MTDSGFFASTSPAQARPGEEADEVEPAVLVQTACHHAVGSRYARLHLSEGT